MEKRIIVNEEDFVMVYDPVEERFEGRFRGVKFRGRGSAKAMVDYLRSLSEWDLLSTIYHPHERFVIEVVSPLK